MYIADLHIHSKYSRATSKNGDLNHLDFWARRKGIGLVGTGDFTHPAWREELAAKLVPAEEGFYRLAESERLRDIREFSISPRFVVSGEISTIYKQDGRVRKVHSVILLPSLDAAERLSLKLEQVGNIRSDGRPILGISAKELLALTLDVCADAVFIPAHIWTPHFSVFGAFSGFESIEECFGDLAPHIRALETGLSSDPPMNRRVPALDGYTLVSDSDAHSPAKLGRESNLISAPLSYPALKRALETGEGFGGTIEFFPEEGKYHLDGHRACGLRLTPKETLETGGTIAFFVAISEENAAEREQAETFLGGRENFESAREKFLPELGGRPRRILEKWKEYLHISSAAFDKLIAAAHYAEMREFLRAMRFGREGDVKLPEGGARAGAVRLSTLHGAKGLEFPVVFLCGADENMLPLSIGGKTDEEEERRLFYVGMTRAKEELILCCGNRPSPFLGELPANVKRENAETAKYKQLTFF